MPNDGKSESGGSLGGLLRNPPMLVLHFAQVLGAPWGYASEWLYPPGTEPMTLRIAGIMDGLGILLFTVVFCQSWRLFPGAEKAEVVASGVILFILGSVPLITLGRHGAMMAHAEEALAPRYYFWTTFFWAALPVTLLYRWPWLRARSVSFAFLALALSAFTVPSGRSMGFAYSKRRGASESATLRLVCGAEDEESLQLFFHNREVARGIVERPAPTYRRLGLDMFSWPGAQWVGETMPESIIASEAIQGRWKIDKQMGKSIRGEATARFSGCALTSKGRQPVDYVLVYQGNRRIVGLGRMTVRRADLNEKFGLHPEAVVGFQGYIRNYSESRHYECRAAVDGQLWVRSWKRAVAEGWC